MAIWLKETDQAIYLMDDSFYLEKIDKKPYPDGREGEQLLALAQMETWLARPDMQGIPLSMVVSIGLEDDEPKPKPTSVAKVEITSIPESVKSYEEFLIRGTTINIDPGEPIRLYVTVDGQTRLVGRSRKVLADGTWEVPFILVSPGLRELTIKIDDASVTAKVQVSDRFIEHPGPQSIFLRGSVGFNGNNNDADVIAVKERLIALGFTFIPQGTEVDGKTVSAIKLFQSIIAGRTVVRGDGRIDVNRVTHRALQSANAPQWLEMPAQGNGFLNFEVTEQLLDYFDHGTDWLANVITAAGKYYDIKHRQGRTDIAPIAVNDTSPKEGGLARPHSGHQCGNACDLALPHKGGDYGRITWRDDRYDQAATEWMLRAFWQQKLVTKILFNDGVLRQKQLCTYHSGHDNHIHVEIGVLSTG
ncbi:MAG: peptidoglycan-binding protein [Cyanothece sp. SIO1E1]|nr:peptidoglycan-binding protein [Cyanothece sp. SIO1E1]